MGAAHGGQIIVSQAVVDQVAGRLPHTISLRDLGSVRLRDLARPERVYQVVHPQLRQDFPCLRSLEATPNNLPQQASSFIGREHVLAKVKALLASTRLLTLVGVGGLGKSRLSLQVGADVLDDFPDGVWFVGLAPHSDARLVPISVASVLGVKEEAGQPVEEALTRYVRDRRLLLIFDNCEHLVQACAELSRTMLEAGSQMKVLATSREPLHVAGETTYSLSPLAVPDSQQVRSLASLTRCEAVRLFIERALAARPAFQITTANAPAVTAISHTLEGIPLAIELAAARVRTLSVEKIAERLSNRFALLTAGDRTTLPRQRTLRACIDWSHDLLGERERVLLRRLAVFAGGFTLEAAEAVGAGGDIFSSEVLELLTGLAEKSLVESAASGERYRLLETVRQYAQERLDKSGDGEETRSRHIAFYLALAEMAEPKSHLTTEFRWFERLDAELENLLAAHGWCDLTPARAEVGLRLAGALSFFFDDRAHFNLGRAVLEHALARPGVEEHASARVKALCGAGSLAYSQGDYAEARKHFTESLRIAPNCGERTSVIVAMIHLGNIAAAEGNFEQAHAKLHQALELAEQRRDLFHTAAVLNDLGELCRLEGDWEQAALHYESALKMHDEYGLARKETVLLNLAAIHIRRGNHERAARLLRGAARHADVKRSGYYSCVSLDQIAALACVVGETRRAARMFGAGDAAHAETGLARGLADQQFLNPLLLEAKQALGRSLFDEAYRAGHALSSQQAIAEALGWLEGLPYN